MRSTHGPDSSLLPSTECADSAERKLLRQIAQQRDAGAFDTLTGIYRESLRRFLRQQTNYDQAAAEDLLQETLLRLWTRADTFDFQGTVHSWLFRIAANLAANYRRTCTRRREAPTVPEAEEENSPALGPEEILFRREQNAYVRRLIAELPDETRELLRLVHDEEVGLREAAAALGIPEGTVKSRLYHTRRKLARRWEEQL